MFGRFKKGASDPAESFPPVPEWRPPFVQPMERIVDRARHYTNGARDFVVFRYGTMVILRDGLRDEEAKTEALSALNSVYSFHPDMNPLSMNDGNILIQYGHDVASIILSDFASSHEDSIKQNYLLALTPGEVVFTPLGPNVFDEFGQIALFGRCYMFMDAQNPEITSIQRKAA